MIQPRKFVNDRMEFPLSGLHGRGVNMFDDMYTQQASEDRLIGVL
jgi:hypothetical protein